MKLYSLLALLLAVNAKELFMDDYNTELGATVAVPETAAVKAAKAKAAAATAELAKKNAAAAALAKKDGKVVKPKCPVLTGAALVAAEAKKCSC